MSRKDNQLARSIIKSIKKVVKNKNASNLHEPELSTKEWAYLKTYLANEDSINNRGYRPGRRLPI